MNDDNRIGPVSPLKSAPWAIGGSSYPKIISPNFLLAYWNQGDESAIDKIRTIASGLFDSQHPWRAQFYFDSLRENKYDVILLNDDYETDGGTLEQKQLELLREFVQQHVPSPSYFALREGDEKDGDNIMSMRTKHAGRWP